MFHPPLSHFVLVSDSKPLCIMARKGQREGEGAERRNVEGNK